MSSILELEEIVGKPKYFLVEMRTPKAKQFASGPKLFIGRDERRILSSLLLARSCFHAATHKAAVLPTLCMNIFFICYPWRMC